jgi:glycosyltransferase involved in cell wall biosynthesis
LFRAKLYTIWNGVDLEKYKPAADAGRDDGPGIRILGVGTIVRRKNIFNLIKALHLANERGARIVIDWFGKVSPDKDSNNERIRCDSLIREYQLESSWSWRGERDNMHEIYSEYDALIHPSYSEGLPNAICEALACGMPILASAVGDHPRLVSNGVNGWLFDPQDPEEIANALVVFARSTQERRDMSGESRRIAEEKLGIGRLIDEHEVILREICAD